MRILPMRQLIALSDYEHMIKKAVEMDYISATEKVSLMEWRKDPKAWSEQHKKN